MTAGTASWLLAPHLSGDGTEEETAMAAATQPDGRTSASVEVLTDDEADTTALVADLDRDSIVPPNEWLTAPASAVVDLEACR